MSAALLLAVSHLAPLLVFKPDPGWRQFFAPHLLLEVLVHELVAMRAKIEMLVGLSGAEFPRFTVVGLLEHTGPTT